MKLRPNDDDDVSRGPPPAAKPLFTGGDEGAAACGMVVGVRAANTRTAIADGAARPSRAEISGLCGITTCRRPGRSRRPPSTSPSSLQMSRRWRRGFYVVAVVYVRRFSEIFTTLCFIRTAAFG